MAALSVAEWVKIRLHLSRAGLRWQKHTDPIDYMEAVLGDFAGGDGVRFSLVHKPSCYRRGPWCLLIEVAHGPMHHKWGCFDSDDQPERYYHNEECARREAESLAEVLLKDRLDGLTDALVADRMP